MHSAPRDPQVEGLVRLGRVTGFRQADGGAARAQLVRNIRPQSREAVSVLLATFHGGEEARRLSQRASAARALGAGDVKELASCHQRLAARAKAESRQARLGEQQLAKDQLEAEVNAGLRAALEDRAKQARLYQEQQEQAERAASVMRLYQRSRREVPRREEFVQHQRKQIQAVRARMSGEADPMTEAAVQDRAEQVACAVQRELWQQLNTASMAAAAEAALLPPALLLTGPTAHTLYEDGAAVPPYFSSASQAFPGGPPDLQLEAHLHLPRASPLRRPVAALMLLPPWKLERAVWQLSISSHERLVAMREGWDPLADAKRHRQAAGEAVDPLYQVRLAQQALTEAAIEVVSLQRQLDRAGRRRLELAEHPAVRQALTQPAVRLRLQSRQRQLSSLQPAAAALHAHLMAKRAGDAREWLGPLARSRAELLATEAAYTPRVTRAMRELEEQGAVRLVPWRKVNGRTAAEYLDEIRSTYSKIQQVQQQPYQPRQPAFGAPPAIKAGF
ncbi:hypothetical protein TSOC_001820 [Tetrabaena socialis]|uniref:Uncharacterized protein n=1 Tax=Tetrabaena socialis TaxID=47790 RepID=A0A2J8AFU9_9CHLO|nr:hypothetical protein TSOC_001820 [Tetrabaena socialis]|eukprot:PNH11390.1 hypothetical protein TSOC_001820 [Tetrabaena socialis]